MFRDVIDYIGNTTDAGLSCEILMKGSQFEMAVAEYILGAVLILISIALIVLVMLQESKQQGLSGAIAGGADTFFGKNKGRTMEAKLEKLTKILSAVFIVLTLVTTLVVGFLAK